jgi:acyl-CoA dehydrogenase
MQFLETIRKISATTAAAHAADVDATSRFPAETIAELRAAQLLSAAVPREFGGPGCTMHELGQHCAALAQGCSSSGMILAMHHIQVACVARHCGDAPILRDWLRQLVEKQFLVASVTSEVGTFGDTRSSICAIERSAGRFTIAKDATTISYGAHADDLLLTCRRAADSPASDQILVLLRAGDFQLEQKGGWDTMGMRGTCSPPFKVTGSGPDGLVVPGSYADSSAQTMVPYSHILWAALWQGIAGEAVARAAAFVRAEARKQPGRTPDSAVRLARVAAQLQVVRNNWSAIAHEFDALEARPGGREELLGMAWALKFNHLKISASEAVPRIVHDALQIVGIMGYKNDSKFSMGRLYRDSLSAALMISNERVAGKSASMLLVFKDDHDGAA